jgi:magnesium chelatase family protein
MDRIDIQIALQAVRATDLALPPPAEGSAEVAARVAMARQRQRERFRSMGHPRLTVNAEADGTVLEQITVLDAAGARLMTDAAEAMKLSARGYHRVLRVARTIADLDGRDTVSRLHLAEALSYRQKPASLTQAA